MKNDFTIFFTFYSNSAVRRKYIEIALSTLFNHSDLLAVPIFVIDGSSEEDSIKNRALFSHASNLTYIHDTEINPFLRCNKHLHKINTKYVLRLLEDCAYINLAGIDFCNIKNDISLMESRPDICVVQYPIINEQQFTVDGSTLYYPAINFDDKKMALENGYRYYNRAQERKHYHYLCNNLLYRSDFLRNHWAYITRNYSSHSTAESGLINSRAFELISRWKPTKAIGKRVVRWIESSFCSDKILSKIVVTETMEKADVIHIGYHSTEQNVEGNHEREKGSNEHGAVSTLSNLRVFSDIDLLNNITFERV
jgi:hypothetical protein